MAKVGEDEFEYESDPEEEKRLLGMRRREAASDDEEGEVDGEQQHRVDRRPPIHSDESEGEGGAADYDDDEDQLEEDEEDYEEEEEEVYEDEEEEEVIGGNEETGAERDGALEGNLEERVEVKGVEDHVEEGAQDDGEGKKENEPFAVPTAGAFYMHDDRFRDNAGGRHRRTYGGRRLWESKDDKKWGHDKFEEMSFQERHYDQGRRGSKGHYQARGVKIKGPDREYARRNKSKVLSNGNNQKQAPKGVRGRGPRKYETRWKRSSQGQARPTQNKQPEKHSEKTSHGSIVRAFAPAANAESDQVPPARKNSSLNSASPPFYPSGSSNKDSTLPQKRDVQAGSTSKNLRTSVVDESFSMQPVNALMRGKNIADSVGIDNLYIDDSVNSAAGKPSSSIQMQASGSLVTTMQSSQSRIPGRGVAISGEVNQPQNQVNKVSSASQPYPVQRNPAQNRIQPSVQAPGQQLGQRPGSVSQTSSPPKTALTVSSYEPGDSETSSESSKSRTAMVGKGKGSIQGGGRGSLMYGGPQVVGATGNMNVGHGDQNFPGSPAFLPVMQFGGQHPRGIGVPAVGMAFPGYVAQPQLGLGNSEITWLPVLAGAAGALGATYCSPYLAVDGAYHGRGSGQTSSAGSSSKENSTGKSNNEWKPSQTSENVNDEVGQRQKPRRYSEMDFKQSSTSS